MERYTENQKLWPFMQDVKDACEIIMGGLTTGKFSTHFLDEDEEQQLYSLVKKWRNKYNEHLNSTIDSIVKEINEK